MLISNQPETSFLDSFNPMRLVESFMQMASMPLVSITIIDMSNNSQMDKFNKQPTNQQLFLEDSPQISSKYFF